MPEEEKQKDEETNSKITAKWLKMNGFPELSKTMNQLLK